MKKGDKKYFCGLVFETGDYVRVNGRVTSNHAAMKDVPAAT
jgi:hypothetical protein